MIPFTESLRYDYPDLRDHECCLDVGCHKGTWANEIARKYHCRLVCFEPVPEFSKEAAVKLVWHQGKVTMFDACLGREKGELDIRIKGDSTGAFADSGEVIHVPVLPVAHFIARHSPIAVLKLNCEGGEFDILEGMIEQDLVRFVRHIQVQPHPVVPDYEKRWKEIQQNLLDTHEMTWCAPWCWEGYSRK